jgi:hypothetical protein
LTEIQIDTRVQHLVAEMSHLPGIFTFSSCGGHAVRTNESQADEGCFYVNFSVEPTTHGWESLARIVWAASILGGEEGELEARVLAWWNGWPEEDRPEDEMGCLDFQLSGDIDPCEIAHRLPR